jgi:ferritin-like metal-binding protein YciE
VIEASDGEEALAWCKQRVADVLVTDIRLPGRIDGWQIAERCREHDPELPVIYATDKASNRELVTGLKNHLEETNKQVERLQKVFEKLGKQPSGTRCPAIDGIIKEADETAAEIEDKAVLDAAIVANAQAVEHYEMCRYGTLIAWAEELGHDEIVRFLTTNLNLGEGRERQAKHGSIAQGRQREGLDRSLMPISCFFSGPLKPRGR